MAVIAVVAAGNVICTLARCGDAVVTGSAGTEHLRVVYRCGWLKCDGAVTVFTHVGRLHVRRALANSRSTVVAAHAVPNDASMIEYRGNPGGNRVAVVTLIVG